jgi:polyisoprenoid-binding protein YceI
MKKMILMTAGLVFSVALLAGPKAEVVTINVDVAKTTVEWKGGKIVGGSHNGTVPLKSGKLTAVNGQLTGGEMVIDMTQIVCLDIADKDKNAYLVGHLKNEDFFNVTEHPTATIKISSFTKSADPSKGTHLVKGTLTIKGITKPVEFYATVKTTAGKYSATAEITIDRSQYDVRYGSNSFFDNLGDKAIKNEIEFRVNLTSK